MSDLTREALNALALVAALCGLLLFAFAAIGLAVAAVRVGVLRRVLVVPFKGAEAGQAQLTGLVVRTLMEIEEEWTFLARQIRDLLEDFDRRTQAREDGGVSEGPLDGAGGQCVTPLVSGGSVEALVKGASTGGAPGVGTSPRSIGDEFLDDILLLEDHAASMAGADLGVVSFAGVSFSPHAVLAVFQRLPGISARRVLTGAIVSTGTTSIVTVSYEERSVRGQTRRAVSTVELAPDQWLPGIEQLAFELAKARINLLREKRNTSGLGRRKALWASGSRSADRTVVEAQSWKACKSFLAGYASQIQHYLSGQASDRERALQHYCDALEAQPNYSRAAYNRATLLYNRYLPKANEEAMECFAAAAVSEDVHDRALALAGLAMAYCQAIHRFGRDPDEFVPKARQASEEAAELAPDLEEAQFARGWAHQVRGTWDDAIEAYGKAGELGRRSPPARRIASFADNNAAWILLDELSNRPGALHAAERLLWDAVMAYPNKIAYANLAEIARRCGRHSDALELFAVALRLDPAYVNGWNERACVELELSALAAEGGDASTARDLLEQAHAHHARAVRLAGDDTYAASLRKAFEARLGSQRLGEALAPTQ